MSKGKSKSKKLSAKNKRNNIILLILLCILILLLIILSIKKIFFVDKFYKIESRIKNVEKMKSKETDDYKISGWIRVQGTSIDYPLIGPKSDTSPLPENIEKYAWLESEDFKHHNVVNIQGHNIMNLGSEPILHNSSFTRFEELMDFVYYDFAKDNKYIQLTLDGKEYLYQIFATGFIKGYEYTILPDGEYTNKELIDYIDTVKNNSIYDYNIKVDTDDNFITLATCTRFNDNKGEMFYVSGRLVKNGERILNYSVVRNKNYEKVGKVLKGDGLNGTKENS